MEKKVAVRVATRAEAKRLFAKITTNKRSIWKINTSGIGFNILDNHAQGYDWDNFCSMEHDEVNDEWIVTIGHSYLTKEELEDCFEQYSINLEKEVKI